MPAAQDANVQYKQQAAEAAVALIEDGMVVGLGTGSTAILAVRFLAQRLQRGDLRDIVAIPSSKEIEAEANRHNIRMVTLEQQPQIDLTFDGADEVDPHLNLIKGGGGAMLREKIIAQASRREVIMCDDSKLSAALGTKWHVPIEVLTFGHGAVVRFLRELGAKVSQRLTADGAPFITDNGNLVFDSHFGVMHNPHSVADALNQRAGVVEHGLFLDLTTDLIVAGAGGVQHRRRANG